MSNEAPTTDPVVVTSSQPAEEKDSTTSKVTIEGKPPLTAEVKVTSEPDDDNVPPPTSPKPWQTALLGLYLLMMAGLLGYLLLKLWANKVEGQTISLFFGWWQRKIDPDARLVGIAMVAGGIGSLFHAVKSFTTYVGNRTIYLSWFWLYLLRPFAGAVLATVFYLILRGGLLPGQEGGNEVSEYGVAALAGLAGMFADQASLKLEAVFDTLFTANDPRTEDLKDSDKVKPEIKSVTPATVKAGQDVDVVITGTRFGTKGVVTLAGKELQTTFVSPAELKASIKATDIPAAGEFDLVVVNPKPSGPSPAAKLKVIP